MSPDEGIILLNKILVLAFCINDVTGMLFRIVAATDVRRVGLTSDIFVLTNQTKLCNFNRVSRTIKYFLICWSLNNCTALQLLG